MTGDQAQMADHDHQEVRQDVLALLRMAEADGHATHAGHVFCELGHVVSIWQALDPVFGRHVEGANGQGLDRAYDPVSDGFWKVVTARYLAGIDLTPAIQLSRELADELRPIAHAILDAVK